MFNFTPLLGAQSSSPANQSLLEFDGGIKVLIDVGWDESFDVGKLKELEKHVSTLSFILLTHATTAHLGAFTYCCKNIPQFARIPVYATQPVVDLGRTLLHDIYASTPLASAIIPLEALAESGYAYNALNGNTPNLLRQPPSPDDFNKYFNAINSLKYSQPHQPLASPFSPPLNGLTITAYSAGHTLGGTIWHIQHGMESVVYAVDWNQAREHVLSGAAWLGGPGTGGSEVLEQLRRPTALICSSKGSGLVTIAGQRNKRDDALLSMIRDTVGNGGSVLIPSDSSARVLELAYLLEETWQKEMSTSDRSSPLRSAKLYLASRTADSTMGFARSMIEWMEEGIVKELETATGGQETRTQRGRGQGKDDEDKAARTPFDFRHLTLLERKSKVNRMLEAKEPRVIIASDTSLEWGFSKDAVKALAADERNLIILTERVGEKTGQEKGLGRFLWELWHEKSSTSDSTAIIDASGTEATIESAHIAALDQEEQAIYQQYLNLQRQRQDTAQSEAGAAIEAAGELVEEESDASSTTTEGSDGAHQGKALNPTTNLAHGRNKLGISDADLGANILVRRKGTYDYYVRNRKGKEKLAPYTTKRRRADDLGDVIRPDEYSLAREEDQVGGYTLRGDNAKTENTVGQKRKWNDPAGDSKRVTNGTTKRPRDVEGSGPGAAADGDSDSEPEDESDKINGPAKVIFTSETISLNCKISFVDFSGLHDRRTIQMLVPLIKPRKLILVAGEAQETLDLAEECRKVLSEGSTEGGIDVFTPTVGTVIDASVDTNAWTVKLSRSMARRLQWQQVRGLGVVAITGRLEAASLTDTSSVNQDDDDHDGTAKKKAKLDLQHHAAAGAAATPSHLNAVDTTPILDVVPANMATAVRSVAQPFHVGDLRLADLRKMMQASGMTAEFRGEGTLVINGAVAVRKTGTGKIEVDGGAYGLADPRNAESSGTFFRVKKKIYEGLAVVAGG